MRKFIVSLGFLIAATQVYGQGVTVQNQNPTSSIANRGSYIADSIFRLGVRDTVKPSWWNPNWSFNGAFQLGLDGKPYYYSGGKWNGFAGGGGGGNITGLGTAQYVPLFNTTTNITASNIYQTAGGSPSVLINASSTSTTEKFQVAGTSRFNGAVKYFGGGTVGIEPSIYADAFDNLNLSTNNFNRLTILSTGSLRAPSLSGTGTRMVVADAGGTLSTQTIPSGSADSITFATNYRVDTAKSNLRTSIDAKLNITDTANIRLRPIAGANMSITGTYPNLTFASSGGGGGGGGSADSITFATNYRVDTAKANLRASIATKLNIADTATMLTPYLRKVDTTAMLGGYLRKVDTASLSSRINTKLNITDTTAMLANYIVNGVNGLTKSGKNLTLGGSLTGATTITTTGSNTLAIAGLSSGTTNDSIVVADPSTGALKRISSSRIGGGGGGGVSGSGTTNFLPKFTASTTLGNSQIFDNGTSVGIGTSSPLAASKLQISTSTGFSTDGGDLRIDNSSADAASITLNSTSTNGQRYSIFSSANAFGSGTGQFGVWDHSAATRVLKAKGSDEVGTLHIRGNGAGATSLTIESVASGGTSWSILSNASASGRAGELNFFNGSYRMTLNANGQLSIGSSAPISNAQLDVQSTTRAFYPPRMTTSERDAMTGVASGAIIYNTTTNKHQGWNGTTWNDMY